MFQIQLQDAKPGEEVAWADGLTIYFGLRYGMGLESGCWILASGFLGSGFYASPFPISR